MNVCMSMLRGQCGPMMRGFTSGRSETSIGVEASVTIRPLTCIREAHARLRKASTVARAVYVNTLQHEIIVEQMVLVMLEEFSRLTYMEKSSDVALGCTLVHRHPATNSVYHGHITSLSKLPIDRLNT